MFVVLRSNPDTSGGAPAMSYAGSFRSKKDAIEYAKEEREADVKYDASWASHYYVYQKLEI